ncbi:MAG: hypothetical protein Kow0077_09640 [Anaerolineae bacterium]
MCRTDSQPDPVVHAHDPGDSNPDSDRVANGHTISHANGDVIANGDRNPDGHPHSQRHSAAECDAVADAGIRWRQLADV